MHTLRGWLALSFTVPLAGSLVFLACSSNDSGSASVCSVLASCCSGLAAEEQESCAIIVQTDSETACSDELASHAGSAGCSLTGASTSDACGSLAVCCAGLDGEEVSACQSVVSVGNAESCAEASASYAGCGGGSEHESTVSDESDPFNEDTDGNSDNDSNDNDSNDDGGSDSGESSGNDSGDGASTYPECTTYANTYCGCLGSIAASDCVESTESDCNEEYEILQSYFDCLINAGCSNFSECESSSS